MKTTVYLFTALFLTLPGIALGDSPYGALQSVHEKNVVLKDLRKICTPQGSPSDEAWEKTIMANEDNQQHLREAIVAMERNNQTNYWEALGKVECPDM
ncbi:YicS family protein [Citrobacter tructae]|uniref:YicS family protein n=1 Tax=Citrobacter tructae TaxID=2562449 RepID=UPI003F56384A